MANGWRKFHIQKCGVNVLQENQSFLKIVWDKLVLSFPFFASSPEMIREERGNHMDWVVWDDLQTDSYSSKWMLQWLQIAQPKVFEQRQWLEADKDSSGCQGRMSPTLLPAWRAKKMTAWEKALVLVRYVCSKVILLVATAFKWLVLDHVKLHLQRSFLHYVVCFRILAVLYLLTSVRSISIQPTKQLTLMPAPWTWTPRNFSVLTLDWAGYWRYLWDSFQRK